MNTHANILYIEHRLEHYLLAFALPALCILSVAYVYLLSMSVVHVVVSRESEEKINEIHGEIASLESVFMERQHAISMEVVEQEGYTAAGNKIFLNRDNSSVVTQR